MLPLEFKFTYQKKKSEKEEKLAWFKDKLSFSMHWLTIIFVTSASFFTGTAQTSTSVWNMTENCANSIFNQTMTSVDRKWPVLSIVLISFVVIIVLSINLFLSGPSSKDFLNIMYYFLGLLLAWDLTYVLQSVLSYPIPSFYQNRELRDHYCCKTCVTKVTKHFLRLDMESRGSFPSFIACGTSYCTIFVFLLACYMDNGQRFAAKLLALFVPGMVSFVSCWYLWQCHENHVVDLVGGVVIGTFLAAFIATDVFLKENMMNKFTDNFLAGLMDRKIQLTQVTSDDNTNNEDANEANTFTDNLYPCQENEQLEGGFEDLPPPYSSLST